MASGDTTQYHLVRGLERGLEVLRALSEVGEASSAQLAKATDLPRSTVHRLLETLRSSGYVTRVGLRDAYRLTLMIKSLADGYHDDDWITGICHPILNDLFEKVVWPTDLATYDDGTMIIRATTHRQSVLSITRAAAGWRVPMLSTATGKAYLAFSNEQERQAVLELLATRSGPDSELLRLPTQVQAELELARRQGYGLRTRGTGRVAKISTIAVPVIVHERVLACLNLNWITSALNAPTVVQRYLPALQNAAGQIAAEYTRLSTARE